METGIKQNGISDLLIAESAEVAEGAEKSEKQGASGVGNRGLVAADGTSSQPFSSEQGESTAGMLKRLAAEYMLLAAEHDLAVRAWAEGLTALVWRPWGGWKVRYAPVGGAGPVETVFIAGEIAHVIAQSPGAAVQVVEMWGDVEERVIGAFLDATPVDFAEPRTDEHMRYHRCVTVPVFNDWIMVNIPAVLTQAEIDAITWTDAPALPSWQESLASVIGDALVAEGYACLPDVLESSEVELAGHWWVREVERCRITA